MYFVTLDLEMNQPSGKILQVGACVGNFDTGEILAKYSEHIKLDEPLNPFIIQLTGITKQQVDNVSPLVKAYEVLRTLYNEHNCFRNPITWGGGDSEFLRQQLDYQDDWIFGRRWIDLKTIFQFYRFSTNQQVQGGLAKSLTKVGLKFEGRKHDALDDAVNTFRLAYKMKALF